MTAADSLAEAYDNASLAYSVAVAAYREGLTDDLYAAALAAYDRKIEAETALHAAQPAKAVAS